MTIKSTQKSTVDGNFYVTYAVTFPTKLNPSDTHCEKSDSSTNTHVLLDPSRRRLCCEYKASQDPHRISR